MKHFLLDNAWEYSEDPFSAYRINLSYGKNKKDYAVLPVKLYPLLDDNNNHILPTDCFKIIKTKEKGTILAVSGTDVTNRALVMVGAEGGFRGGVELLMKHTTADILYECHASNNCESKYSVAAIMSQSSLVVFHAFGRKHDIYLVYDYDGKEVILKKYTKQEFIFTFEENIDNMRTKRSIMYALS